MGMVPGSPLASTGQRTGLEKVRHMDKAQNPIKVIFLCATAMSSSLIAEKVREAAAKQGIEAELEAMPAAMCKTIDYHGVDAILLGPQVRHQLVDVRNHVASLGIPVESIGFVEYGMVQGDKIWAQIVRMMQSTGES